MKKIVWIVFVCSLIFGFSHTHAMESSALNQATLIKGVGAGAAFTVTQLAVTHAHNEYAYISFGGLLALMIIAMAKSKPALMKNPTALLGGMYLLLIAGANIFDGVNLSAFQQAKP